MSVVDAEDAAMDPDDFAGLATTYDLIVVDVHGVVLNRPWIGFLGDIGERTGEGRTAIVDRWKRDLRLPFWEGRLDEHELWSSLDPAREPDDHRADLERRFGNGPMMDAVMAWNGPVWILSNHRSDWLLPRLERFGIRDRFERVIVSDALGAAKPSPTIFGPVVAASTSRRVCFIDDQQHNVDTARSLGIDARRSDPGPTYG